MQARYHYLDQSGEFVDFHQQCRIHHRKLNMYGCKAKKKKKKSVQTVMCISFLIKFQRVHCSIFYRKLFEIEKKLELLLVNVCLFVCFLQ